MDDIKLNNDVVMPRLGLGTWQIGDGQPVVAAVSAALAAGYRLIDTATIYGNEAGVGQAIRNSSLPRAELFVTTKLWNSDQGRDAAIAGFEASLERLGLDYVDLYLIHWPDPKQGKFVETWKAFEQLYKAGRVRAIGVSNFKPPHLEQLLAEAEVIPAVNQIELHPRFSQAETREFCDKHGIKVESYSPLMRAGDILHDSSLQSIAADYEKTVPQVIIRWHLQHGLIVIPKSSNPERIAENFDVFDFTLSESELAAIDQLDSADRIGSDPDGA